MEPLKRENEVVMKQLSISLGCPEKKYAMCSLETLPQQSMKKIQCNRSQQGAELAICQMQAAPKKHFPFRSRRSGYYSTIRRGNNYHFQFSSNFNKQLHYTDLTARCVGVVANYYTGHLR